MLTNTRFSKNFIASKLWTFKQGKNNLILC
jgi:putative flippase GtrA